MTDDEYDVLYGDQTTLDCELEVLGNDRVDLPWWVGSLDAVNSRDDLAKWWPSRTTVMVSMKLDGVSALYHDGHLMTRGNGKQGRLVDHLLPHLLLPKIADPLLGVRGELVVLRKDYAKTRTRTTGPRNFVASLLQEEEPSANHLAMLRFYPYEILRRTPTPNSTMVAQMALLAEWGFLMLPHAFVDNGPDEDVNLIDRIYDAEPQLPRDGVVVTRSYYPARNSSGNPGYARAFKRTGDVNSSVVERLEWQTNASTGLQKPVVHLVEKGRGPIRGHDASFVRDRGIDRGAVVVVHKSIVTGEEEIYGVVKCRPVVELPEGEWDGVNFMTPGHRATSTARLRRCLVHMGVEVVSLAALDRLYELHRRTVVDLIGLTRHSFVQFFPDEGAVYHEALKHAFVDKAGGVDIAGLFGTIGVFDDSVTPFTLKPLFQSSPNFLNEVTEGMDLDPAQYRRARKIFYQLSRQGVSFGDGDGDGDSSSSSSSPLLYPRGKFFFHNMRRYDWRRWFDAVPTLAEATVMVWSRSTEPGVLEAAQRRGIEIYRVDQFMKKFGLLKNNEPLRCNHRPAQRHLHNERRAEETTQAVRGGKRGADQGDEGRGDEHDPRRRRCEDRSGYKVITGEGELQ